MTPVRRSAPRRLAVALLLVAGLALPAGCVRLPTAGPVVETRSSPSTRQDQATYIDPRPPQRGDSPPDIVKGFLDAMTATPIRTNVAKEFLTRAAQASWSPERQTITYAGDPTPRGRTTVSVPLSSASRLDSRGAFRGDLSASAADLRFPMVRVGGEWRISRAPDALIVPESWFEERFRQVSLYFFDPSAQILVPEPVYMARGEQLATTLTNGLLQGPGPGLGRISRSFIPPGLTVGLSVPVSADGVADIALKGDAGQQTPQAIELMMAQLVWTLRQEPSIRALRVTIGGEPVSLPGGVSEFSVNQGAAYDPTGARASSELFGLHDGLLVSGGPDGLSPVDGPLGTSAYGVSAVTVDLDGKRVAAVSGDGRSILLAPVIGPADTDVRQVVSGASRLLRPSWDFAHRLWLVDAAPGGARVSYVSDDRPVPVTVPGITGRRVRSFLVSRDGSRMVAVVHRRSGDALMVSRLLHDDKGRVLRGTRARRIAWEGTDRLDIRDLAWQSPTTVAVLAVLTDRLAQVRTISVDGSPPGFDSLSYTLNGQVRSLAGSPVPSEPLYVVYSSALYDLSNAERGSSSLGTTVSALDYVG